MGNSESRQKVLPVMWGIKSLKDILALIDSIHASSQSCDAKSLTKLVHFCQDAKRQFLQGMDEDVVRHTYPQYIHLNPTVWKNVLHRLAKDLITSKELHNQQQQQQQHLYNSSGMMSQLSGATAEIHYAWRPPPEVYTPILRLMYSLIYFLDRDLNQYATQQQHQQWCFQSRAKIACAMSSSTDSINAGFIQLLWLLQLR
jgi:hypothetical protein